jgi:hypothetical protein
VTSGAVLRIAVFNGKGGCGKTTLAWNLAMGLGRRAATLLLDADPQGSLAYWAEWSGRDGIAVTVQEWGATMDAGPYAFVVTDCAPRLEAEELAEIVATGEGLSASQPNASGGSVESTRPAAAMESHPQGAAGSTPKGGNPGQQWPGFCFS